MKFKYLFRAVSLLVLVASQFPANHAEALAAPALPPADMFQLPWEQGLAWVALDGFDNGIRREPNSPHNHHNGGAIDFAPHTNMRKGENTSSFWVTAAAAGTIVETSKCHVRILHSDGWITDYYHLATFQVKLGDVVTRNQRLAVIANASSQPVCPGSEDKDTPHLHFKLWPTMIGATFAGWEFKYNSFLGITTFTKGNQTVGLFKPLLNELGLPATPTPSTATPVPTGITPTPSGPYVSTAVNPTSIGVGDTALVSVSLNSVPAQGYTSAEFTCSYNANLLEASNIIVDNLFGADAATAINDPQSGIFIIAIAGSQGNKATTSGVAFTFNVKALQGGQTPIECTARVNTGNNVLTDIPSLGANLTIIGSTATPTSTPIASPTDVAPLPTFTPTPTAPGSDWLTFTNSKYGFEFRYPPQGQVVAGNTDNFARINLPFGPGTNLSEKYLEVIVVENANPCRSPLATSSMLETSETVVINGISFLKETGGDAGAGHLHQWIAYSTFRDIACVSMDFILHSLNPGNLPTPPPVFDYAAETTVFGQIVSTYAWLALVPTATPTATQTSIPGESPTPTFTSTPLPDGFVTGRVLSSKIATVGLYDSDGVLVISAPTANEGSFQLSAPAGSYTVKATANGFLSAEGSATLISGSTVTKPTINLLAGDIDNNNVVDQFDAMTIGMSYNTSVPAAADLNNDGIINVLDLELLALNYRKTGPVAWQ